MSTLEKTFILTGARLGKSCRLKVGTNFVKFVEGALTVQAGEKDMEGISKFLARCYQCYPEGSVELQKMLKGEDPNGKRSIHEDEGSGGTATVPSEVSAKGGGVAQVSPNDSHGANASGGASPSDVSPRDGHEDSRVHPNPLDEYQERIKSAVMALDPGVDENWTSIGLPPVSVVETVLGSRGVTRKILENVLPGWTREEAVKSWAVKT